MLNSLSTSFKLLKLQQPMILRILRNTSKTLPGCRLVKVMRDASADSFVPHLFWSFSTNSEQSESLQIKLKPREFSLPKVQS